MLCGFPHARCTHAVDQPGAVLVVAGTQHASNLKPPLPWGHFVRAQAFLSKYVSVSRREIRGLPWLVLSVQPESAQVAYVVRSSLLNRSAANELRKACDTCDTFSLGLVRRSSARVSLICTYASHVSQHAVCAKNS